MLSCIQVFFDIFVVRYVFASLVLCSKHHKQVHKNTRAYGQTSLDWPFCRAWGLEEIRESQHATSFTL